LLEIQTNNQHLLQIDDISPVTKLTGFKIKISGRLARQRVIPKKTVKTTYKGAISPNKYNLVDQATFTGKNKKGAYSIRV
jgi:S-ribosylhomocysteine lyase LuxS involved in autoinducer biosynthesis